MFKLKHPLCDIVPSDPGAVSTSTGNTEFVDEIKSIAKEADSHYTYSFAVSSNSFSDNQEDFYNFFHEIKEGNVFSKHIEVYFSKNRTQYPIRELNLNLYSEVVAIYLYGSFDDIEAFLNYIELKYSRLFNFQFTKLDSNLEKFEKNHVIKKQYVIKPSEKNQVVDLLQRDTKYYKSAKYPLTVDTEGVDFLFFDYIQDGSFLFNILTKSKYLKSKVKTNLSVSVSGASGLVSSYFNVVVKNFDKLSFVKN